MLKKITLPIITQVLSIYLISLIMDKVYIGSLEGLLVVSAFLSVLNITLKPILKLITFPITLLTLGLFKLIINGVVLYIAFLLAPNAYIHGLGAAIVSSVLIVIASTILDSILD